MNSAFWLIRTIFLLTTFLRFLTGHLKKVKSHVFFEIWKKRKIRILEHWSCACLYLTTFSDRYIIFMFHLQWCRSTAHSTLTLQFHDFVIMNWYEKHLACSASVPASRSLRNNEIWLVTSASTFLCRTDWHCGFWPCIKRFKFSVHFFVSFYARQQELL